MCVICVKNKNFEIPSKKLFEKMWNSNSDGAGFSFKYKNKIVTSKGFMNFDNFYKTIQKYDKNYNLKKRDVVFHFRIATNGKICAENCHPFDLEKTGNNELNFVSEKGVFFHNGILADYSQDLNFSDSLKFCNEVLTKIVDYEALQNVLNVYALENYSKFVIFTPRKLILCGDWNKKYNYYFSNLYFDNDFKNRKKSVTNYYDYCDYCFKNFRENELIKLESDYKICENCFDDFCNVKKFKKMR